MIDSSYASLSLFLCIIVCIGILLEILVGGFLIAAGKQIAKLQGNRRLVIGCYIIGALCFVLAIIVVINWILFFVNLGPNARIEWR